MVSTDFVCFVGGCCSAAASVGRLLVVVVVSGVVTSIASSSTSGTSSSALSDGFGRGAPHRAERRTSGAFVGRLALTDGDMVIPEINRRIWLEFVKPVRGGARKAHVVGDRRTQPAMSV